MISFTYNCRNCITEPIKVKMATEKGLPRDTRNFGGVTDVLFVRF